MKSCVVTIPAELGLQESLSVGQALAQLKDTPTCVLDLTGMRFVEPFALLYLSACIRSVRRKAPALRLLLKGATPGTYAAHMGFYGSIDADIGPPPSVKVEGMSYLPITRITIATLRREAAAEGVVVQELLQRHARQLARVLIQEQDGPLVDTLQYAFLEILRNAVEHSGSPTVEYCAQYWPSRARVQMAILDQGVGVQETLRGNPNLQLTCDLDAIHLSLLPGISGKMYGGVPARDYDHWQHSGFWLYMTSRLCQRGGSFFLASGQGGLLFNESGKRAFGAAFQGTALQLVFNTARVLKLADTLRVFAKEGDSMARTLKGATGVTGATASRMLRDAWS